jgi:predicted nucleotidyltransferase
VAHSTLGTDADGFILPAPDCSLQPGFEALVRDVRDTLVAEAGPLLDGIYLYGSVARGSAEAGSSDLDLTLVFRDALSMEEKATVEAMRKALEARHSDVVKIDFDIGSRAEALAPGNRYSWGYWLKHHCRCLWGNDLTAHFERFKPSRDIALAVNGDFGAVLRSYAQGIDQANHPIELQRLQKEASRKLIRATNVLRTDEDSTWPQNLEDHARQLLQRHPSVKPQIDFFLSHARSPTASGEDFSHRLRAFVEWMEKDSATR